MSNIVCVGDNTVDIYVDRKTMYPGGNAVNVAAISRRLGAMSAYIGCISLDRYGTLVYDALLAEGVDLALCRRSAGPSPMALVGHRENDRYFIGSMPGIRADYVLSDADFAVMAKADVVHTSVSSDLDGSLPKIARHAKCLSYDFSNRWLDRHLVECAPLLDVAFISAPARDENTCIDLMWQWAESGTDLVVMTRGDAGSLALVNGLIHRQGIVPTEVIDTLGAGDGFISGFLTSHAKGLSVPQALQAGASSAASSCRLMGAFGHGREHPWPTPDLPAPRIAER
ncbi:sugar kinase [Agrobacterium tumefaciens]|uniref:PfkB family carbohydrate kinase n=1 Tax=Agrobacterium tumefaciens TaxID=358 RepID=UPI0012B6D9AC|nr:PfkB family carbohydrate kinase [Agrobacterium tumefaciens]MQB08031.1 sugar kinase [Agrobacterium tumefaciens]